MHPDQSFRWDRAGMRAFVEAEGFGALYATTPAGPRVAHVPATFDADDAILFHLARANALTPHLDGSHGLFVVQGPHAYVSPRWYAAGPDQVPTWNYLAVEIEGHFRAIGRDALVGQIDALARSYEDENGWRLDEVDPRRAEAMLDAIQGFVLEPREWRGTRKLSQNKPVAVRARVVEALGDHPLALAMRGDG